MKVYVLQGKVFFVKGTKIIFIYKFSFAVLLNIFFRCPKACSSQCHLVLRQTACLTIQRHIVIDEAIEIMFPLLDPLRQRRLSVDAKAFVYICARQ